jgi:hypothetical protein
MIRASAAIAVCARVCAVGAALLGCDVESGGLPNQPPAVRPPSDVTGDGRAGSAPAPTMVDARAPIASPPDGAATADAGSSSSTTTPSDAGAPDANPIAPAPDAAPPPTTMPPPTTTPPVTPPPPDAAPPPPPASCPSDPQLSVCLRFEGNVADESTHGVRLTTSNVAFEMGPSGMAARLGPTSSIRMDESDLLDGAAITVEAWLSPRVLPGAGLRQGIADSPGQYGMFLVPPADVLCIAGDTRAVAPNALKVGTWISAACTFEARAVGVWINGRRVAETPSVAPISQNGDNGLSIGLNSPSGENFQGSLDNFRLWRSARTAAQLCASAHGCQ